MTIVILATNKLVARTEEDVVGVAAARPRQPHLPLFEQGVALGA